MPFVVSILKYMVSVVPEDGPLVLDRTFHDVMGKINPSPDGAEDDYICREGIPIPAHLFDKGVIIQEFSPE